MTARTVATAGTVLVMLVAAGNAVAQPDRMDPITAQYGGVIHVTSVEGDSRESLTIQVTAGMAFCNVSFTDEEGTRGTTGPGLFHLSLGLAPPVGKTQEYSFEVACPNAMYKPARAAAWSHVFDSYKRLGGLFHTDPQTRKPVPPDSLSNSFNEKTDEGSLTMSWVLCRGCKPPPP